MLKKTVVLVGMMGAGKTAVGKAVATALDVVFTDSDDEIVEAANMSIPEIFERDGESFFRAAETRVLTRLLQSTPCILSTGGGAFMRAENRELISNAGVSVWLNAPLEVLWERVRHKNTRPLLRTADPLDTLTKLYNERCPIYQNADVALIGKRGNSIMDTADELIALLATQSDVLEVEKNA